MNVKEFIDEKEAEYGIKVIYLTKSGSTLYGTNGPNSDIDYKGIFIPNTNSVLLKTDKPHISYTSGNNHSSNTSSDTDIHLDSISTFIKLLAKGETGAIDLLFSMFREDTIVLSEPEIIDSIKDNYKKFYGSNLRAFVGYCIGQSKMYNIKGARYNELVSLNKQLSTMDTNFGEKHHFDKLNLSEYKHISLVMAPGPKSAKSSDLIEYLEVLGKKYHRNVKLESLREKLKFMEDQFGHRARKAADNVDWKALSHAVRVILEVEELLSTDFIKFPLHQADFIKQIKSGKIPLKDCIKLIEERIAVVDELMKSTKMQDKSDTNFTDNFLLKIYKQAI